MSKHLIRITGVGVGFALIVAASAFAHSGHMDGVRVGNLVLRDSGGISPTKLPKHEQVPIKANLNASGATVDGSHLPAAREVIIDIDKNIHVNAEGLPVCKSGQLEARNTNAARQVCREAIVGRGSGHAEIAFPEQKPIMVSSPLTMFNGGVNGRKTTIFIHAFITVPIPAAIVTVVKITPIPRGHYGIHTVSKIPAIAGGAGSVTDIKLRIDRKFTYKGQRKSYLTASCPTGRHFIRGSVLFDDDTLLETARVLPCTPKG